MRRIASSARMPLLSLPLHARPYIGAVRDKVRRLPSAGMERAAGIDERQIAQTVGATPARAINLGQRDRHEKGSVLHPRLGAAGDDEDQSQEPSGSLHSPVISVFRERTKVCARSHPSTVAGWPHAEVGCPAYPSTAFASSTHVSQWRTLSQRPASVPNPDAGPLAWSGQRLVSALPDPLS